MDADKAILWLKDNQVTFDLVFLDPPYAKQKIVEQLEEMLEYQLINPFARVVCETDKQVDLPESIGELELVKTQVYGTTKVTIYKRVMEE